jgi:hypothetical protein
MSVLGRFLITKERSDKTPGLRNVLVTGPYFHDGSMQTLWDVTDHYNKGDGIRDPWLDKDMQPLALTEPEIDDVVAFLASLTSPQNKEVGDREYARELALSKVSRPQRDTARTFGLRPWWRQVQYAGNFIPRARLPVIALRDFPDGNESAQQAAEGLVKARPLSVYVGNTVHLPRARARGRHTFRAPSV